MPKDRADISGNTVSWRRTPRFLRARRQMNCVYNALDLTTLTTLSVNLQRLKERSKLPFDEPIVRPECALHTHSSNTTAETQCVLAMRRWPR